MSLIKWSQLLMLQIEPIARLNPRDKNPLYGRVVDILIEQSPHTNQIKN